MLEPSTPRSVGKPRSSGGSNRTHLKPISNSSSRNRWIGIQSRAVDEMSGEVKLASRVTDLEHHMFRSLRTGEVMKERYSAAIFIDWRSMLVMATYRHAFEGNVIPQKLFAVSSFWTNSIP